MTRSFARLDASRRLTLAFVLVLLVPAAAVVWLGLRLIEQDCAIAYSQLQERRESAADRLVASLEQAVASTERRLAGEPAGLSIRPDDDAVLLTLRRDGIEVYPRELLYAPMLPPGPPAPTEEFERGESLEFASNDLRGAAAIYGRLARSPSPTLRAGGLLRLARTLRKLGDADRALEAYADLARIPDVRLAGLSSDLVARRARCTVLAELGRQGDLERESRALLAGLLAARWPIDEGTFLAYTSQIARWLGTEPQVADHRDALSAASAWVWRQWVETEREAFPAAGRRALHFAGVAVTLLWQSHDDQLVVLVAGPRFQQREWFDAPLTAVGARGLRVALSDADGQSVRGTVPADAVTTEARHAAVTHLPWSIFVSSLDEGADLAALATRRRLLFAGLVLLVGLVLTAGYVIVRAVARELAVTRLQSDFVSAVSHEFRTPLTSLRQFTELLNEDPAQPAEKRRTFYAAQARATDRLARLVESLLDFGRMEAGARPYRLERTAVTPLVRSIVDDFRRDTAADAVSVQASLAEGDAAVDVDPEAFTRALRNLLDNAVKYSGADPTVVVSVALVDGAVVISVRDRGIGIPRAEQDEIFKKFVRGTGIQAGGIRGTGIGLAMVRQIVEAHGGTVSVDSAPGEGSTFTIVLPAAAGAAEVVSDPEPPNAVEDGDDPRWLAS